MIFRGLLATLLAAMAMLASTPAIAKPGDAVWVKCAWQTAPVSADNWLNMPVPNWQTDMEAANSALALRLLAVCATEAPNDLKPNRTPNWKQIASALKKARPKAVSSQDASDVKALMCKSTATTDSIVEQFKTSIEKEAGDARLRVFEQYYTFHDGKRLVLPQDLRSVPPKDAKIDVSCQQIGSDGSLTNA